MPSFSPNRAKRMRNARTFHTQQAHKKGASETMPLNHSAPLFAGTR